MAELRARFPQLPGVENYVSPKHANARFGGHFLVRVYPGRDDPDEGVEDEDGGLARLPLERGEGVLVAASAGRANVEVMFWADASEITPKAEETWAVLTSCLGRVSPREANAADSADVDDSWRHTALLVLAVGLAIRRWQKSRNP